MRPRRSRRRSRRRAGHRHARAGEARVHRTRDGVHAAGDAAGDADMARVASRSALSTFYRDMFHERSTPRRQSRARVSRSDENVEHASNEQIPEKRPKNLMVTPRLPRLPTLAVAHAPAGSHDRWVQSAAMVASRPTVMAPPRSHAPPRAFLAHFNAQKMANARLKHAGSRLTLRSKTAQARRSLTATQELRDTFATIDAEGTWGLGTSPARARTARTRPARAADRGVARPTHPSSALKRASVCAKRAVPRFPTLHAFPRRFRGFVKRETARARRKRSKRDWKNQNREKESSRSLFSPKAQRENRPTPVCRLVKWQKLRRAFFGFTRARFFFSIPAPAPRLTAADRV